MKVRLRPRRPEQNGTSAPWRRLAAWAGAAALAAGVLMAPSPAAAAEDSGLETWGAPTGATTSAETTAWQRVFPSGASGQYLVLQDGQLAALPGTGEELADIPPAVVNGSVRDAAAITHRQGLAITADGSLHRWGVDAGALLRVGTWTPAELGGKAVAFGAESRYAVVVLDTGRVVEVSNLGVSEVTRDGAPLAGVREVAVPGSVLLEDGTVGRVVNAEWTTTIPADPEDPVVDISIAYGVTASGRILSRIDGSPAAHVPTLDPETDGIPNRAIQLGETSLLLTDKGNLVAWRQSDGGAVTPEMQVPEVVANGTVRELIQGGNEFMVWMGVVPPLAVTAPSSISGSARVGETLSGVAATFSEVPDTVGTQWRDADTDEVLASDTVTLELTEAHLGRSLEFVTTATRGDEEPVVSVSAPVGPVAQAVAASTTSVTVTNSSYGQSASARVVVGAAGADATGSVAVTVDGQSVGSVNFASGQATIALPRTLAPGAHTVRASYAGSGAVSASAGSAQLTVAKAAVAQPTVKVTKKPRSRKAGKATVTVPTAAGLVKATGTVVVTLKKGKKTKKVTAQVTNGVATVKLRKLPKGKWKLVASYGGDGYYNAADSGQVAVKVK